MQRRGPGRRGGKPAETGGLAGPLYAEKKHALLIVLQGMDASGKDGTIRHVMNGINPQDAA